MDTLDLLKLGETAYIKGISLQCKGEVRQRLLDLGFVRSSEISVLSQSPLGDPTAYQLHRTTIALRKEDAQMVSITREKKEI